MSYSFTTPATLVTGNSVASAVLDAFEGAPAEGQRQNGTYTEARAAINIAAEAASRLVDALGPNVDTVSVNVVGHANPGNVKTEGWADEFCNVGVSVRSYKDRT